MSESDNVESQKYEIWKKKRNIKNNEISKRVKYTKKKKKKKIIIKKIMKLQEKWNLKKKKKKSKKISKLKNFRTQKILGSDNVSVR